ncbi:MAG TPA: SIMPL domain-containing protein [Candidatus Eisenbacteria bacterium]|nr:SIMPL domain-containing protein [Candidatus Eisenbacteria bacterium]
MTHEDDAPPRGGWLPWAALSLGIALAGWFVGMGVQNVRTADRFVSVKGVAEREVKADLALWPIQLAVTDNDLSAAQTRLAQNAARVVAFLRGNGIDSTEIELQTLRVTDIMANPFRGEQRAGTRFILQQVVNVRSDNPERVQATSQKVGELVNAGVVLTSGPEWGPGGPSYLFRKLNDLKPGMIAEATAQARKAAEQFAKDSRSRLGGIHRANQGVFVILPRDASGSDQGPAIAEATQMYKIVRVVSTVEYQLR